MLRPAGRYRQSHSAERLVRRPQPLGQHAHDLEGEIRGLADQKQKLLFGHRPQLDAGDRRRGRAARLIIDQRHLAEDAVRSKFGDRPVADLDSNLTALDHEKVARLVALPKDDASGLEEGASILLPVRTLKLASTFIV